MPEHPEKSSDNAAIGKTVADFGDGLDDLEVATGGKRR
jgi:hypothetical protein